MSTEDAFSLANAAWGVLPMLAALGLAVAARKWLARR